MTFETAWTGHAEGDRLDLGDRLGDLAGWRSAFVSTITGSAPLSQAAVR